MTAHHGGWKQSLWTEWFGPELRHQRELRGWTAAELARRSGYDASTIKQIERGKGYGRATLEHLIEALGEEAAVPLIRASGFGLDRSPDPLSDDLLRALDRRLKTASPQKRRALRNVLRALEKTA